MILKSTHFPNEVVATRRGSPLIIGVKTAKKLKVDFVDVEFGADNSNNDKCVCLPLLPSTTPIYALN